MRRDDNGISWSDHPLIESQPNVCAICQERIIHGQRYRDRGGGEHVKKDRYAHEYCIYSWKDEEDAWLYLSDNFTIDKHCVIRAKPDYEPEEKDFSAIDYLWTEWDYGYEPKPSTVQKASKE